MTTTSTRRPTPRTGPTRRSDLAAPDGVTFTAMSAEKEQDGGKGEAKAGGFTVTDRRIFADDKGTARVEDAPPADGVAAGGSLPAGPDDDDES